MVEKPSLRSLYVASIGILTALMAVLSYASIVIPTPLGSYDASSVLIFAVAILYGPEIGLIITVLGQFIGKGLLITYSGLPAVYIPGVIAVRGVEAYVVGYLGRLQALGRYRESIAMVFGVIWETFGFVIADIYLWGMIGGGLLAGLLAATFTIWTIVDLIWIPLGIAAIYYIRNAFKATYLDKEQNLNEAPSHGVFLIACTMAIVLAWGLILIAGFFPRLMAPVIPLPP